MTTQTKRTTPSRPRGHPSSAARKPSCSISHSARDEKCLRRPSSPAHESPDCTTLTMVPPPPHRDRRDSGAESPRPARRDSVVFGSSTLPRPQITSGAQTSQSTAGPINTTSNQESGGARVHANIIFRFSIVTSYSTTPLGEEVADILSFNVDWESEKPLIEEITRRQRYKFVAALKRVGLRPEEYGIEASVLSFHCGRGHIRAVNSSNFSLIKLHMDMLAAIQTQDYRFSSRRDFVVDTKLNLIRNKHKPVP